MSLRRPQKTLAKEGSISGLGVHTGEEATVFFKPAPAGTGIRFLKDGEGVTIGEAPEISRRTAVGGADRRIHTVEHLLAALHGLEITNLIVDVHGPEVPILDGSAEPFVRLFKSLGILDQPQKTDVYAVREPIFCHEGSSIL